jgi:hypothetical protein
MILERPWPGDTEGPNLHRLRSTASKKLTYSNPSFAFRTHE